ncbi:MAG: response regulator transcription factor [Chlorobiaceae bacterium]|nr:response regulator transcription factor [Chlorobiaceae bacterium]
MNHQNASKPSTSVTRLIIAEDDTDLRESLVKYLTLKGYEVAGVGSALELYQQLTANTFKIAIIDIGLPDQNGLVLTEYLRANTDMRIIILTARSKLDDKLSGYQAGADVFMVKPVNIRELEATIDNLLRRLPPDISPESLTGNSKVPEVESRPEIVRSANWSFIPGKWLLVTPDGKKIKLTPKERDFISLLASVSQEVATRQELLKCLEYLNNEYGHRALESLVNRLRRKIKDTCGHNPIETASGIGYSFIEDIRSL